MTANDNQIKDNEYSNITTGLKRIQFRLERANTPQKFVDAFETVNRLIEKFPLKSKVIWQAVSTAYTARYGSTSSMTSPVEVFDISDIDKGKKSKKGKNNEKYGYDRDGVVNSDWYEDH